MSEISKGPSDAPKASTNPRYSRSSQLRLGGRQTRQRSGRVPSAEERLPNNDVCDSCGLGGELLCCDNCPNTLHLTCVNPPLDAIPEGEWYCQKCRKTKKESPNSGLFSKGVAALESSNPSVFMLPDTLYRDVYVTYPSHYPYLLPNKKRVRTHDKRCRYCEQEVFDNQGAFCSKCTKSYHLWCVEPPLLCPPTADWECEDHKTKRVKSSIANHLLSKETVSLDFFPYERVDCQQCLKRRTKRPPVKSPGAEDSSQVNVNYQSSRSFCSDEQLSTEQQHLLKQALEFPSEDSVDGAEESDVRSAQECFQALQNLTPLFTQFLAFQRLVQLHKTLQASQNQKEESTLAPNATGSDEFLTHPSSCNGSEEIPRAKETRDSSSLQQQSNLYEAKLSSSSPQKRLACESSSHPTSKELIE